MLIEEVTRLYDEKVETIGEPVMRHFEKAVMLQQLDTQWKEHLAAMDYLRQGIHLRGYAQKNPKQEYKREAFQMFSDMLDRVKHDTVSILSRVQIRTEEEVEALERQRQSGGEDEVPARGGPGSHRQHRPGRTGPGRRGPGQRRSGARSRTVCA